MNERNITCEIVRPITVLSENERGYTKEINLVSWNGAEPKFDIRNWHLGREKSGKGRNDCALGCFEGGVK